MNPYLEQADCWEDFHRVFLVRVRAALIPRVGSHYIVKLEARLLLRERSAGERGYVGKADVGVATRYTPQSETTASSLRTAPVQLSLPAIETVEQLFLEIQERHNRRDVTVIELLSPSNKDSSSDREIFLTKRNEILNRRTHYVEIDLLRGGQRPSPPELPKCDYYALVSRVDDRPRLGFWPIALRERLPEIPVTLNASDPDATFDLQAVLNSTYDEAGYERYIYDSAPEPPLSPEDQSWAQNIIAKTVSKVEA
jgi:hypothetical protein